MPNSQLDNLKFNAIIEKERKNESIYFKKFTDLLIEKRSSIVNKATTDQSQLKEYQHEMKIIKKILAAERDAIIGSFVVGTVAFLSVRTLPRLAVRFIGGEAKMKSLKEAELKAKNGPNAFLRRSGTFLFESMFGFWAGWRGYHMTISNKAQEMVDDITTIPLCEGRSVVADELCNDLTNLIQNEIPHAFWKNLDLQSHESLQNESTWRHIMTFCDNCTKRKLYEEQIRKKMKLRDDEPIIVPPPGIPKTDIVDVNEQ